MNISEKIVRELDRLGMKKSELARASGVAYTTLDSMIRRNPDSVNIRTLFKIADALGVSADYLAHDEITDRNYRASLLDYIPEGFILSKSDARMLDTYLKLKNSDDPEARALASVIDRILGLSEHEDEE